MASCPHLIYLLSSKIGEAQQSFTLKEQRFEFISGLNFFLQNIISFKFRHQTTGVDLQGMLKLLQKANKM